jgi:acyl carrier protein
VDTKSIIRTFIIKQFLKGERAASLADDTSFIDEGIIDSLGVLELATFIEETFGFRVEDEEMMPENLDCINHLVTYVNSKLASSKV